MDSNEEAGKQLEDNIHNAFAQLIPGAFGEHRFLLDSEDMRSILGDRSDLEDAAKEISKVFLVGQKQDTVFDGLESQGMSTLKLQLFGSRLVIAADIEEVLSFFPECQGNIKSAIDKFKALTVEELPDSFSMPSLCAMHVRVGDMVFCPYGYLTCEKAISDASVCVRTGTLTT